MTFLALLIIPLVAGYSFAVSWQYSRYRIARSDGYSLYFSAALYGMALLVMAALTLLYLVSMEVGFVSYIKSIAAFFNFYPDTQHYELRLASLLTITLIYGVLGGPVLNVLTGSYWPFKLWPYQIAIKNSDFERLVLRAIKRSMPMLVTLDNGKVYVGYVIRTIDPLSEDRELRILPVFSGFRSPETGEVVFTTNYSKVYMDLLNKDCLKEPDQSSAGDFEVVIPVSKIITSTLYDNDAYERFHGTSDFGYKF